MPKFIRCGSGTFCCNGGFCARMRFRLLPSNYGAAAFPSLQTSPANQRGFVVRGELTILELIQAVMGSDDGPHGFSILYCCTPVRSGRAVHRPALGTPHGLKANSPRLIIEAVRAMFRICPLDTNHSTNGAARRSTNAISRRISTGWAMTGK
ncbi:hypothetical protein E0H54_10230 [Rhizobium leguminosarum bv. viciae]|nr:hypothetical protein E0H54_10230 [Rhizobium leguminosarum bv. viciae]